MKEILGQSGFIITCPCRRRWRGVPSSKAVLLTAVWARSHVPVFIASSFAANLREQPRRRRSRACEQAARTCFARATFMVSHLQARRATEPRDVCQKQSFDAGSSPRQQDFRHWPLVPWWHIPWFNRTFNSVSHCINIFHNSKKKVIIMIKTYTK
jgi:hypothetical protein